MQLSKQLYYLPGRGGKLHDGLGAALSERACTVYGREMSGAFQRLRFSEQVALIAEDLRQSFWSEEVCVVGNSFGAYFFLHAQATLPPFPGKVLLLSPIVGGVVGPGNGPRFCPPFADLLIRRAESQQLSAPLRCQMHVGALDWQCPWERVKYLADLIGAPLHVVPDAGHVLPKDYVGKLLDEWLS